MVRKLKAGVAKLKMMLTLMRDRRVLLSTMLYGLMAGITIISSEVCKNIVLGYTCSDIMNLMQETDFGNTGVFCVTY